MSEPHVLRQGEMEQLNDAKIQVAILQERVLHLNTSVEELKALVTNLTASINTVERTLSEAQGGWKTLMWIGGMSASVGAAISWVISHLGKGFP
jgi:prefoldin subunit 5